MLASPADSQYACLVPAEGTQFHVVAARDLGEVVGGERDERRARSFTAPLCLPAGGRWGWGYVFRGKRSKPVKFKVGPPTAWTFPMHTPFSHTQLLPACW